MSKTLQLRTARIFGVAPALHSSDLDRAAAAAIEAARTIDIGRNPILRAWRKLLEPAGELPAPQLLLELALRSAHLPHPDTIVGACNLVSLRTLAAITAHDLDRATGDPHLITTTGRELFHPLGRSRPYRLPPQQWAVIAGGHVLTYLDSRQSARTQVTLQTRNVLICVQSPDPAIDDALRQACDAIVTFSGGRVKLD